MEEAYWSDIGDSLGLSIATMRSIRAKFGSILGITSSNRIPRTSLGAVSMITSMLRQGVTDEDITKALLDSKTDFGWPDQVLERIKEQGASLTASAQMNENISPCEPAYTTDWVGCLKKVAMEQKQPNVLAEPVVPVRDMILDLRREINTSALSEREQIHRLGQIIETLIREIRDLRYSLIMASSRKDRKKGLKGISRLLSR